jgi:hypothetical protein
LNLSAEATSALATVTSVGHYCFRADYQGDTLYPASSDRSLTECFAVTPVTPTLTTLAGASPVDFGNAVTDTATLTGTANAPGSPIISGPLGAAAGGTITFTLYGPDSCTRLATGTGTNPQTVAVSGDNTYGPVSFTPDAPGVYNWKASYSGDSPNTNATPTVNATCTDVNEDVTVRQIPTLITTTQKAYPQDSATITSSVSGDNLGTGGTVVFTLYGPTSGLTTALQNCTANGATGLLYTETSLNVGGAHSVTVGTNNTTAAVATNDTFYWRVTYQPASTDTVHTGRQSVCIENITTAFVNDSGPGTVYP